MIKIYPTTTLSYQYQLEDGKIIPLNYRAVSLYEYLHDKDIDPFYIESLEVICKTGSTLLNTQDIKYAYLAYLDDPKEIIMIFPKDNTGESWLNKVLDIQLTYKHNLPNWGDDDYV